MPGRPTLVDQVRETLLEQLLDGRPAAGEQLPNEAELARHHGVSRATVREAVGGLVEAGYVVRRHGRGTFVTGRPRHRHALDSTVSYLAMILEAGMEPGELLVSKQVRQATIVETQRLSLRRPEPLVCIERVRTADGQPAVYSLDRIPRRLLGADAESALDASLYDRLRGAGIAVHHAAAELRAVCADARVARMLAIQVGVPLQLIEQVDFTADGSPVMLSTEWHAPGVFELRVNRHPLVRERAETRGPGPPRRGGGRRRRGPAATPQAQGAAA